MKSFLEFADGSDSDQNQGFDAFANDAIKQEPNAAAIEAGKSIPPEQAAEAIKISTWTGVDPSLAIKKAQAFQQNIRRDNSDYEVLAKTAPITSDWGSADPFRASVVMDDMRNLARVEEVVKDDGMIRSLGKTLYHRGLGSLAQTIGRGPALAYSLYALPYNIIAKATGGQQAKVPDGYLDNDVTRYWEEFAKKASPIELEESITNELVNGNPIRAGRIAAFKVAANLPQQAVFVGSALAGAPALGLTFAGVSQGSEALKEGAASDADPYNQALNAITQGAVEVWTEGFGTFGLAEKLAKKFGKEAVKKGFLETVKTIAKDVFMTGVSEGNEEVWAQAMQTASSRVTGVDTSDFNWGTFLKELGDSFIVGAASALATTAPGGISTGIGNRIAERKTQQVRDFYMALGDSIEATETRKRLPQATREHVEAITKGSNVQDILIPIDAFETYFQGENIDPSQFAKSVNAAESYDNAKSVGGYVKIPTSVWAEKVVGTPHYGNLSNDVKFNPGDMTVNELKSFSEEMGKSAEERKPEVEQAGRVFDDFKSKAKAIGFTGTEADAHAVLVAERYRRRAQILGEDAFSLYEKDNIQINRPSSMVAPESTPKVTGEGSKFQSEFDAAFTPNERLDQSDKNAETQAVAYAKEFAPEILSDYAKGNGNTVATDKFRTYFEPVGFNGLNTPAFHEPASALRRVYQKQVEDEAIKSGKLNVVLMAGGSGSGKSSTIDLMNLDVKNDAGMIIDSNLSDVGKAKKEIAALKKKGLSPTVLYVYRDPVDAWVNGVMRRLISGEDVRTVPLSEHIKLHRGSYETALTLAKEDPGNVFLIDNSRGLGNQKMVGVAELAGKDYNEAEIRKVIINETIKLFQEGKISASEVQSAIGETTESERGLIPESVRDRSPKSDQKNQIRRKAAKAVPDFRTLRQSEVPPQTETKEFKNWFGDSVVTGNGKPMSEGGKPLVVYHGAQRPDRIGVKFKKNRATSGPMQYFTDDPTIASSYSEGKKDTSLETPDNYSGWFKYKAKGARTPIDIDKAWFLMSSSERAEVTKKIYTIGYSDPDSGEGQIVGNSESIMSKDSIDHQLRESKGNALLALVEIWLNSGSLFDIEDSFMDVLNAAGLDMGKVSFDPPFATKSGVFPVYLSIKNPLKTSDIPSAVVDALEIASKGKRIKKPAGANGDFWDKNTISGKDWIAALKEDIANGTTHAWTRVPDWVTDTLKRFGFDGIKDIGGKLGGKESNVYVPFEPTQIKSATGNAGTFDPNNPNILMQSAVPQTDSGPIFFSQLQKTIEQKMPNSAPIEQVKGIIGGGAVKQEEIDWSGINDFLAGKKTVTKAELLDFLKENQVEITEVVKGGSPLIPGGDETQARGLAEREGHVWGDLPPSMQREFIDRAKNGEVRDNTKFSSYQLPGGENYREVLLTLPVKSQKKWRIEKNENDEYDVVDDTGRVRYTSPEYMDASVYLGEEEGRIRKTQNKDFSSTHFAEPNILAHVRMNDRTTADGKKILFLEEVQSDWHQAGRDKGYATEKKTFIPVNKVSGNPGPVFTTRTEADAYVSKFPQYQIEVKERTETTPGVPNAPFKKSWHELALKRMLRYAVDNGYDGIAWTTGEQQAERYDLSKQVRSIAWAGSKKPDSPKNVTITPMSGNDIEFRVMPDGTVTGHSESGTGNEYQGKRLSDVVGKEVAEKITGAPYGDLSGLDLKVGGEGMRGFYDKIIPAFLNKYTKKWDGRVGETKIGEGVSAHSLDITPAMRESVSQGQPLFQAQEGGSPRAQVRFGNTAINIDLFSGADPSSLLHELSHVFTKSMGQDYDIVKTKDAATLNNEQIQFIKDAESLLSWVGSESFGSLTTEQHEQIARGWEAYFHEGKAPSQALRGVFSRFREWLLTVYRSIRQLDVTLNPEVRRIFDRMLASQEEIDAARDELNVLPLFSDAKSVGMTDAEAKRYVSDLTDVRVEAEDELTGKLAAETKREQTKIYQERKSQVEAEVSAEVDGRKEYVALYALQRGKLPNGEPLPEGLQKIKLSKQAIVETYGEEFLKKLPRPFVYSAEGGLHPDQAALLFGFNTGHELLSALETIRPKESIIAQHVDEQMRSEFGDMRLDGTITKEAMKAVHNDKRAELLKKEMEFLVSDKFATFKKVVRRVTRPVPSVEAVRDQAVRHIATLAPRDIYPSSYQRTEAKESREAIEAMLKGDIEKAFSAKLRERLNHELFRAAVDAKDEIDSMVNRFKRFEDDAVRNKIGKAGGQYLEQIDGLLDRYDFRKSVSLREIDRRKSLLKWVNEQNSLGFDVNIPDAILDDARRISYKDTPYGELVELNDAVETISHLANMKTDLLANKKHRDVEAAQNEIVSTIKANHKGDHSKVPLVSGVYDKAKEVAADFVSSHTKMEFFFEFLDGMNPVGATFQNLWVPFLDAKAKKAEMMRGATVRLREIFGAYKKSERAGWYYKKIAVPEIGETLNKATILSVALNWGNEYNRDALMRGYKWSPQQVEAILKHLDQKDWTTVQSIWDFIDSYWPMVKDIERKISGRVPEKVQASVVKTQFGEFRGGYYPISFDSRQSWRQRVFSEAESVQDLFGGQWAKAMTRHGHTIARTNTGGKPLLLNLSVLSQHVENVIHDLSYREAVIDVSRIVDGENVREAIQSAAGNKSIDEIQKWIRTIAGDRTRAHVSWMEGLLRRARNGATVVNLGLRFTSGISQSLGYLNTIKEIGPKYAAKGLRDVFREGADIRKTWEFISSKSSEMANRTTSFDRDVRDAMRKLSIAGTGSGPLGAIDAYTLEARESFFYFIGFMDLATSVPTWMGAYQKALDGNVEGIEKADDASAVLYADKVVRETQSAGDVMDLARIQTGSELHKTFTMFYSQASLQFNQFLKTAREFQLDGDIPRLVASAALIWFLPAVLEELIRGRGPGDDEDPTQWIAENELYYPFQTMILLRDIVSGLQRSGYEPSPAYESINSLTKSAKVLRGLVIGEKEDITKSDVKNIANTVGYFAQLPTRQTWITLEYIYDWMTGEEEPENPIEGVWRSLVGKKR